MSRGKRDRKSCVTCGGPHAGSTPKCKRCKESGYSEDVAPRVRPPFGTGAAYQRWMRAQQITLDLDIK